jgi:hypothetical protein
VAFFYAVIPLISLKRDFMLQRVQSVWLLLAATCAFLSIKLPFYIGTNKSGVASYNLNASENYLLLGVTVLVAAVALFTIFLYKNRTLQLRLCFLGILLEALLIFLYYRETQTFVAGTGTYALTSILHSLVVIFFVLAARGINKDEKLIKNSDRLR